MWNLGNSVISQACYDWSLDIFKEGTLKQKNPWQFTWNKIGWFCFDKHILIWGMLPSVEHSCTENSVSHVCIAASGTGSVQTQWKLPKKYLPFLFIYFFFIKNFVILQRLWKDMEGLLGHPGESNIKARWATFLAGKQNRELWPLVLSILSLI